MVSGTLKADIEAFAETLRRDDPLLQQARSGRIKPQAIAAYLRNIHYLLRHTPVCLVRARDRALALGQTQLAAFFEHKLGEESGHEAWAESDMAVLENQFHVTSERAAPAIEELVEYLLDVLERRPTLYLAYVLFAEYFTVLLGPEWVALLEQQCGIPRSAMTAIVKHAELDQEHTVEGLQEIDLLTIDEDVVSLREALATTMRFFSKFTSHISRLSN